MRQTTTIRYRLGDIEINITKIMGSDVLKILIQDDEDKDKYVEGECMENELKGFIIDVSQDFPSNASSTKKSTFDPGGMGNKYPGTV